MCLLIFICLGCGGGDKKIVEGKRRARTGLALYYVCRETFRISQDTGEPPPTLHKPLVLWLRDHGAQWGKSVRVQDGLLVDGWGNPMHLVVEDGRLLTLGSSGPNGRWEEGTGDDILGPPIAYDSPEGSG